MPRIPEKTDYSQGFPEGFEVFASIKDLSDGGHTLLHFGEILFIAFPVVLCGVRSYELMEEFAEPREDWLRKWLKLPNGAPAPTPSLASSKPSNPPRSPLASPGMTHHLHFPNPSCLSSARVPRSVPPSPNDLSDSGRIRAALKTHTRESNA